MARPSSVTEKQNEIIRALWLTDATLEEIISATKLTNKTLRRHAIRLGFSSKRDKKSYEIRSFCLDKDEDAEIVRRFENGESVLSIASSMGLSATPIYRALKAIGHDFEKKYDEKSIIEFYNNNLSIYKTMRNFRISNKTLLQILKDNSVEIREKLYGPDTVDWSVYDPLIRQALDGGATNIHMVADIIGLPYSFVYPHFKQNDIQFPNGKTHRFYEDVSEEEKMIVRDRFLNLDGKKKICREMKISFSIYDRIVTEQELSRRWSRIPEGQQKDFIAYAKLVRRLSKIIIRNSGLSLTVQGMSWDHKLSVIDCYLLKVPVIIAANLENLELIVAFDNHSKNYRSSTTLEQIYRNRETKGNI